MFELNEMDDQQIELAVSDLFNDPDQTTETTEIETSTPTEPVEPVEPTDDKTMTKTMTQRINKVRADAEAETQDRIAKSLGFTDYAEMSRQNEKRLVEDAGFDSDEVEEVVRKLLEKRLSEDPRLKKLEEYENREKSNFVRNELDAINKLAGTRFTGIDQLPPETLSIWEKTGNLKQAYLATQGEALITRGRENLRTGSLTHLAAAGVGGETKIRGLTEQEKDLYRSVMPDVTEEELSKKTTEI